MNDSAPATSSPAADRGGAPVLLALCPDHQRPVEQSYRACTVSFSLADAPLAELEQLAVSAGATLYEVLLAAFQALATRHSGSDDIILGSPNAARGSAQLEALTGSVVPVDPAVSQLRPQRSLSHNPVFQVVFTFHEEDRPVALPGEVQVPRPSLTADTAKSDLTWSVYRGQGELCPVGVVGEIYVGGSGLTRGYTGHPDLTAARFVPDHLGDVPGRGLYRGGDLGRWNAYGDLEYFGRSDTQVKVRGYRMELGEIEAALERSPDVQRAIALAAPAPQGDSELRVYAAVTGRRPDSASLRAYLESVLPRYMVPSVITVLDELPLNTNGKVDTSSLLALDRTAGSRRVDPSPPRTPLEQEIAAIWAQTLEVDVVDLADDFFGAGGNSVLAMRMLFVLRDRLLVDITLASLIEAPNLRAFCAEVEKRFADLVDEVDLGSMIAEQAGEARG